MLSNDELKDLRAVVEVLRILFEITTVVEGQNYATVSYSLVMVCDTVNSLREDALFPVRAAPKATELATWLFLQILFMCRRLYTYIVWCFFLFDSLFFILLVL